MSNTTPYGPLDVTDATPATWKQGKKPAVRIKTRVTKRIPSDPAMNAPMDPAKSAAARMDPVEPRHAVADPPVKVQGELMDPAAEVQVDPHARFKSVLAALRANNPKFPKPSSKALRLQKQWVWVWTMMERIALLDRMLKSGPMTATMRADLRPLLKDCWESFHGISKGIVTELGQIMAVEGASNQG